MSNFEQEQYIQQHLARSIEPSHDQDYVQDKAIDDVKTKGGKPAAPSSSDKRESRQAERLRKKQAAQRIRCTCCGNIYLDVFKTPLYDAEGKRVTKRRGNRIFDMFEAKSHYRGSPAEDYWYKVRLPSSTQKAFFCDETCYKDWNAQGRPGEQYSMIPHVKAIWVERVLKPALRAEAEVETEAVADERREAALADYGLDSRGRRE
jgi:hypothetical protein